MTSDNLDNVSVFSLVEEEKSKALFNRSLF